MIRMPRVTSAGFNTSAIFGFVNTLEDLLRREQPTHMAVCFDPAGSTFRKEAFENYKGEREATPEDIKQSIPIIKEIIKAYNIPIIEVEGFEADDVIGTLSRRASTRGYTTYMMTPDKDFGQLVGPNVLQYKPGYRGGEFEIRGEKEVCGRYGIQRTSQVIDLLALMGDKVDSIPGCPGVGEKTAVKLIAEFGDVENLVESTDKLKGALKKKVEENVEQIKFSKFLATIRTDVPIEIDEETLRVKPADTSKLFAIFDELEFRTLRQRVEKRISAAGGETSATAEKAPVSSTPMPGSLFSDADFEAVTNVPEPTPESDTDMSKFDIVSDAAGIERLSARLMAEKRCGIVLITTGDNDMTTRWLGTAIAIDNGKAWYVAASMPEGKEMVLDLLARGDIEKVTSAAKRDAVTAARYRDDDALPLENYYDITLAHYLLQPEMRHDMDLLASQYLHETLPLLPEPPRKSISPYETADMRSLAMRACAEASAALRLRDVLQLEVEKENMWHLLRDIELPLAMVLADMELTGVRVDVAALDEAAENMRQRIAALEKEIYELAGVEFNIGSPAKVGEVLFERLGLTPKPKKTKTGQYSTSEDVLEKVAASHPIVGKILSYRQLKKLLTTYLVALPQTINTSTGRIHTNYNQSVTATGRISSSNPNLQNIPIREEEGRDIRKAFIADEGSVFFSADYSQIELRLVADFSGDETMVDAFAGERDIHAATAAKIYHKNVEDVTADERRHAKTANFGILYGISAFGLANRLGIPRGEAKDLIDAYFASFPSVAGYIEKSVEKARENGYVSTPMGRKRRLPDINSRNAVVRGYAERNAVNAPIQGFAADIIKKAMVAIWRRMREEGLKSKMIMQVHDELNFNVVARELPRLQEIVIQEMEGAYKGKVKLTASSGVGANWLEAH